jgi:hypothetical protein
MNDSSNPVIMALLFILRCLVPVAVLFGISYLLRKMGFVSAETPEPPDDRDDEVVSLQAPDEPGTLTGEMNTPQAGKTSRGKAKPKPKEKSSKASPGKRRPVETSRSRRK